MRSLSNEKCLLTTILWWSLAVLSVAAIIVAVAVKRHNYLLEKAEDEKDSDIKECGC
ncbi:MAG: hypothetical protein FWF51_10310 [Chitinivibrionia bacterium]|jgi:hypothetical protein|nr:hypothetical protein [Chitinivibrionia bacterium]